MKTTDFQITDWIYRKIFLAPFSLDRENGLVLWVLLLFSGILFFGLYHFDGNIALVSGIMYLTFVFGLSLLSIHSSFFLFMFSVMLFEQYDIPNFPTFTREVGFFSNLKEIHYVPFMDAGVVSPAEIHLLFIIFAIFIHAAIKKDFSFKPIPVWFPFLLFFGALTFNFLNGLRRGGDFLIALWEVRALVYLCVMYVIVPQILDTKKQLNILFWIIIVGVAFKALQGVQRFIAMGFTTGGFRVLTNHEDAVFIVTVFILLIGFLAFQYRGAQRKWIFILLLPLILGFYVAQRRATYASFMVSLGAFIVLLPSIKRIKFLKYFTPAVVVLFIYGFIFWNNNGPLGRPVQMIKSGIEKPDKETNFEDYSSNLYREYENYNLAQTVVNNPILGVGFGRKYDQPISLINIRFTLRDYIPHNEIFWIMVKMGTVGFFAFWFFFNSFVVKGIQTFVVLQDPYLKAITALIIISIINQMVVSYFDLQLTYYRNMLYLGFLMGLLPVINHIHYQEQLEPSLVKD